MIKLLSIADVVSLTNAVFGFLSILMVFLEEMQLSFVFILLAILADGLDGVVARRIKHSDLGESMDSIADVISAGIAPAVFIYASLQEFAAGCIYYHSFLIAGLIFFVITSIIRLASFHLLKNNECFLGMPAPASTMILILVTYLEFDFLLIVATVLVVSLMMITSIRFPKPKLKMDAIAAVLIFLTILTGFFDINYKEIIPIFLLGAILIYSVAGPLYFYKKGQ